MSENRFAYFLRNTNNDTIFFLPKWETTSRRWIIRNRPHIAAWNRKYKFWWNVHKKEVTYFYVKLILLYFCIATIFWLHFIWKSKIGHIGKSVRHFTIVQSLSIQRFHFMYFRERRLNDTMSKKLSKFFQIYVPIHDTIIF